LRESIEATLILRFSEPVRLDQLSGIPALWQKAFLVIRFDDDYLRHVVTKPDASTLALARLEKHGDFVPVHV
jgi:hypothetical protein